MSTTTTTHNESLIAEPILSAVCWDEKKPFNYCLLVRVIVFLKSGRARSIKRDYHDAASWALNVFGIRGNDRGTYHRLLSNYFKQARLATRCLFDDRYWGISILEKTNEIFLCHHPTLTRSQFLHTYRELELVSVQVEDKPCSNMQIIGQHQQKGKEVLYRIVTGRL